MKDYFSRLSSSERRFIVFVGLLFFVVINIFFVWPHFSDWGVIRGRLDSATTTLATFNAMFEKTNALAVEVDKMQRAGANVPAEDQAVSFLQTIQKEAGRSGVQVGGTGRLITRTNQFFMEQIQTISVAAGEKQLVDFLYNLGSGDSLVRVRDLSVRPDPQHQQLQANITLIASYQKNARVAPAAKAAKAATAPAAAANPAMAPAIPPRASPGAAAAPTKPLTPKKK